MGHPITAPQKDVRALEQEFAYLHASGVIDSSCLHPDEYDGPDVLWLDTEDTTRYGTVDAIDISDEIAYLDSRRLLLRHPEHPNWVQILDEDEPLADTTTPTGETGEQPGLRIREVIKELMGERAADYMEELVAAGQGKAMCMTLLSPEPYFFEMRGNRCAFWTNGMHIVRDGQCRCGKRFQLAEVL